MYRRSGESVQRYEFARQFCHGKSVVDVGCGAGLGALLLRDSYSRYVGMDPDPVAVKWSQSVIQPHMPQTAFFELSDAFRSEMFGRFDVLLSFEVIEHVTDVQGYLRFLDGLSFPSSLIVLSTPNGAFSDGKPNLYRSPYHMHEYSLVELKSVLRPLGRSMRFLGQSRRDGLDILMLKQAAKIKSVAEPDVRAAQKRLGTIPYHVVFDYLNRSAFWRLQDLRDDLENNLSFSSIIVVLSGRTADP